MYAIPEVSNRTDRLLNVSELAERLAIPKSWIYQRTRTGEIPMLKVGKYRRFRLADVLKWLEKQNGNGDAD